MKPKSAISSLTYEDQLVFICTLLLGDNPPQFELLPNSEYQVCIDHQYINVSLLLRYANLTNFKLPDSLLERDIPNLGDPNVELNPNGNSSVEKIPKNCQRALLFYLAGYNYPDINSFLRGKKIESKLELLSIKNVFMVSLFASAGLSLMRVQNENVGENKNEPQVLYRGLEKNFLTSIPIGQSTKINFDGFLSTTESLEFAKDLSSGNQGAIIKITNGTAIPNLAHFARYSHEDEFLFPPGTTVQITRTSESKYEADIIERCQPTLPYAVALAIRILNENKPPQENITILMRQLRTVNMLAEYMRIYSKQDVVITDKDIEAVQLSLVLKRSGQKLTAEHSSTVNDFLETYVTDREIRNKALLAHSTDGNILSILLQNVQAFENDQSLLGDYRELQGKHADFQKMKEYREHCKNVLKRMKRNPENSYFDYDVALDQIPSKIEFSSKKCSRVEVQEDTKIFPKAIEKEGRGAQLQESGLDQMVEQLSDSPSFDQLEKFSAALKEKSDQEKIEFIKKHEVKLSNIFSKQQYALLGVTCSAASVFRYVLLVVPEAQKALILRLQSHDSKRQLKEIIELNRKRYMKYDVDITLKAIDNTQQSEEEASSSYNQNHSPYEASHLKANTATIDTGVIIREIMKQYSPLFFGSWDKKQILKEDLNTDVLQKLLDHANKTAHASSCCCAFFKKSGNATRNALLAALPQEKQNDMRQKLSEGTVDISDYIQAFSSP